MPDARPPMIVELEWSGDLRFNVSTAGVAAVVDGDSKQGPSPVQHAAMGLAGCMAGDVVDILRKGRHDVRAFRVTFSGTRAQDPPRRFLQISLRFEIQGSVPPEAVERAISLSREKYCSVWHSFRQDIGLSTSYHITA